MIMQVISGSRMLVQLALVMTMATSSALREPARWRNAQLDNRRQSSSQKATNVVRLSDASKKEIL